MVKNIDYAFFCCDDIQEHIYLIDQKQGLKGGDIEDKVVYYSSKYNEYGIPVYEGDDIALSYVTIACCPWCGTQLPASLRQAWFNELERLGYDFIQNNYPSQYHTWDWWLEKKEQPFFS